VLFDVVICCFPNESPLQQMECRFGKKLAMTASKYGCNRFLQGDFDELYFYFDRNLKVKNKFHLLFFVRAALIYSSGPPLDSPVSDGVRWFPNFL